MPDNTLGAYQRHEPLTADDFANADFARHADGRIARRANPDLWVYNQPPSSAPVWSVCRDMAEDGDWSPVRGCPDPDVHLDRDAGDAAVRWMIRTKEREARAQQAEKERDDARALLAEAQEEATRQAARADQAELDRDNARRWLRETEALLDQAGHERDEARAERDHFHEVAATFRDKFNAAESHPLAPSGHAPTSAIVAAVLPIVDEEVRKAKAEAWNEGCRAAEQYYKRTIIGIPGSDPIPAPINPHETGDQA